MADIETLFSKQLDRALMVLLEVPPLMNCIRKLLVFLNKFLLTSQTIKPFCLLKAKVYVFIILLLKTIVSFLILGGILIDHRLLTIQALFTNCVISDDNPVDPRDIADLVMLIAIQFQKKEERAEKLIQAAGHERYFWHPRIWLDLKDLILYERNPSRLLQN